MKKLIFSLILAGNLFVTSKAQTPIVDKFTKLDVILLETPEKGSVVPTSDGGYFMSKGLSLTKYNSSNTVVWTQSLTASKAPAPFAYIHKINSICDDGNGGAIITGEFNGTLFYGNDSLTPYYSATGNGLYSADAFVARVNQTGKVWWYRFGEADNFSLGTDRGVAVKVSNNKVYWLAHGKGLNLRFNSVDYPRTVYSNNNALLCQFSMDGTVDWVNVSKGFSEPAELAINSNGIFYTGFNLGNSAAIDFGNNVTIKYNQGSLFAVKYNPNGVAQWAVTYDDDNSISSYYGLSSDDEGNLYVNGLSSKWTSSYGIRKSSGYIVKINGTDGKPMWSRFCSIGLKGPSFSNGKIYVAGNTSGSTYLQSNATDSILFKKETGTTGSEQWIAAFDKNGNLSGSLKASVAGGIVGGTMEYLQGTNNRVIMVGIYSYGNTFGNVVLPMTGMNVGAYHIGFFELPTGTTPNGIDNKDQDVMLSIYPNPATNFLKVETLDNSPILSITLIDIAGKTVYVEPQIKQNFATIPVTELNKGIYILSVSTAKGNALKKIIID